MCITGEMQTRRLYSFSHWVSSGSGRRGQLECESARVPHSTLKSEALQVTRPCVPASSCQLFLIFPARPGAHCLRLHLQLAASSGLIPESWTYLPWALPLVSLMLSSWTSISGLPPSSICHRHYSVTILGPLLTQVPQLYLPGALFSALRSGQIPKKPQPSVPSVPFSLL